MKNLKLIALLLTAVAVMASCNRIDAGHVGIKVKLYGEKKGVQDVTECTGMVFYAPWNYTVKEFATYVRHKEYTGENGIKVIAKGGSVFTVEPILNYYVKADKVVSIFKKFRLDLEDLEDGFIKTSIFEAYRIVANNYTADSLISSRSDFDNKVRIYLEKQLIPEGFHIQQFTSSITPPKELADAITLKNTAIQKAIEEQNKVAQATAKANAAFATTQGQAKSIRELADARAYANLKNSENLTEELLKLYWIEAWKYGGSKIPSTMLSDRSPFLFQPSQFK